ncbi:MAG: ATP-grasp domain-containing protein [Chloroflexi bacterium]|nr:ATP-grasp domain-containing protein [Chloroflexota bacterium]
MKIGLAYDLKETVISTPNCPEDALEEYDSPETVEALATTLESLGHSVIKLGGGKEFITNILHNNVDFVFNISEGLGNYKSREAQVPSILEMLDIPYSGSDPQCLAICLDKSLTKRLVAAAGVRTPKWQLITDYRQLKQITCDDLPLPAFVKPAYEGSSKGIRLGSKVETTVQIAEVTTELLEHYKQPVMVEEFIAGDEVTVGMVGNSPPTVLGVMRVLPKQTHTYFIYSLEIKREWEQLVDYECPARLEPEILEEITDSSLKIFKSLGCRDFARLDFKLNPQGVPYFLEINPLAGLNSKSSDLSIMASNLGWTYQALISTILNAALQRYPQCVRE